MLPEKLEKLIGQIGETGMFEVEKGAIKRYADSVGDRNPLYWDDEYARNSRYGAMIAPPGFFGWPTQWKTTMPFFSEFREKLINTSIEEGFDKLLDGGSEYDFMQPIRAGDILASMPKIIAIIEREGKSGVMLFSTLETTFINQHGVKVAKYRQTIIHRK